MMTPDHELSISSQAKLLNISRGTVYYLPKPVSSKDLTLMRQLDELHLQHSTMGAGMLRDQLNRQGFRVGQTPCIHAHEEGGHCSPVLPEEHQRQASWA
jgi:putative transposase